jgi:hypothetical protein
MKDDKELMIPFIMPKFCFESRENDKTLDKRIAISKPLINRLTDFIKSDMLNPESGRNLLEEHDTNIIYADEYLSAAIAAGNAKTMSEIIEDFHRIFGAKKGE